MKSILSDVRKQLLGGEEVSFEQGCALYRHPNLLELGMLANEYREKLHADVTYYNRNLHLNSTNVCEADCLFCSFARLEEGMPQAYTFSVEQAKKWIAERYKPGMTEIHIVNGLNKHLPFSYYQELLSMIKSCFPALHIKAFTAVEIHYFSEKFKMSYGQVLEKLVQAGLDSMPGGGAEIFAERVRKKICRDKVDTEAGSKCIKLHMSWA